MFQNLLTCHHRKYFNFCVAVFLTLFLNRLLGLFARIPDTVFSCLLKLVDNPWLWYAWSLFTHGYSHRVGFIEYFDCFIKGINLGYFLVNCQVLILLEKSPEIEKFLTINEASPKLNLQKNPWTCASLYFSDSCRSNELELEYLNYIQCSDDPRSVYPTHFGEHFIFAV